MIPDGINAAEQHTAIIRDHARDHHRHEYERGREYALVYVQIQILERHRAAGQGYGIIPEHHKRLQGEHFRHIAIARRRAHERRHHNERRALGYVAEQYPQRQRFMFPKTRVTATVFLHYAFELSPPFIPVLHQPYFQKQGNAEISDFQHAAVPAHTRDKEREQKHLRNDPDHDEYFHERIEPQKQVETANKRAAAEQNDRRRIPDEVEYQRETGRAARYAVFHHIIRRGGLTARRRRRDRGIVDVRGRIGERRTPFWLIAELSQNDMYAERLEKDKQQHTNDRAHQIPRVASGEKLFQRLEIEFLVALYQDNDGNDRQRHDEEDIQQLFFRVFFHTRPSCAPRACHIFSLHFTKLTAFCQAYVTE